jgi:hypothetical protein
VRVVPEIVRRAYRIIAKQVRKAGLEMNIANKYRQMKKLTTNISKLGYFTLEILA